MRVKVKRVDHVQICIPFGAEEEVREFYTGVLGFMEIEKPDALKQNGGLWYDLGNVQLHIGVEDMGGYRSKRHPAFEVTDLEKVRHYLEQRGVVTNDEKPIPGERRFTFYDPFGNRMELLEYVN